MYHKTKKKAFDKQVGYLTKKYNIISIDEAINKIKKNSIQGNEIVITFDDGYKNNYTEAFPILKKYNKKATIFLISSRIDSDKYAWYDIIEIFFKEYKKNNYTLKIESKNYTFYTSNENQKINTINTLKEILKNISNIDREKIVKKLSENLHSYKSEYKKKFSFITWKEAREMLKTINFGAHSVTHPILTKCSKSKVEMEIMKSQETIQEKLKTVVDGFCFPNGDYDDNIINILKEKKYNYACSTKNGGCYANDDVFKLNRIGIGEEDSVLLLKLKLSKIWMILR